MWAGREENKELCKGLVQNLICPLEQALSSGLIHTLSQWYWGISISELRGDGWINNCLQLVFHLVPSPILWSCTWSWSWTTAAFNLTNSTVLISGCPAKGAANPWSCFMWSLTVPQALGEAGAVAGSTALWCVCSRSQYQNGFVPAPRNLSLLTQAPFLPVNWVWQRKICTLLGQHTSH